MIGILRIEEQTRSPAPLNRLLMTSANRWLVNCTPFSHARTAANRMLSWSTTTLCAVVWIREGKQEIWVLLAGTYKRHCQLVVYYYYYLIHMILSLIIWLRRALEMMWHHDILPTRSTKEHAYYMILYDTIWRKYRHSWRAPQKSRTVVPNKTDNCTGQQTSGEPLSFSLFYSSGFT